MKTYSRGFVCALICLGMSLTAQAADEVKPLNKHEIAWSQFASQVLSLHKRLIKKLPVVKRSKLGGYAHQPEFYREDSFVNTDTQKLVSRVRWERAHPDKLHTIEVYIYDDQNRVARDYTAAYLPNYYRSPTQTLISFHAYHGGLHAFRTFDADGYRVDEGCRGEYQGKPVEMIFDEDEIADGTPEMKTDIYQVCFDGLREKAGKYLTPQ